MKQYEILFNKIKIDLKAAQNLYQDITVSISLKGSSSRTLYPAHKVKFPKIKTK
jgi:hypothetical protein